MTTHTWHALAKRAQLVSPVMMAASADADSYDYTMVGGGSQLGRQLGYSYMGLVGPPDESDPSLDGYIPASTLSAGDTVEVCLQMESPLTVLGAGQSSYPGAVRAGGGRIGDDLLQRERHFLQ